MSTPTVLITGASRGIGLAIANSFAKEGYRLFLTCKTNFSHLQTLQQNLQTACHTDCQIFCCDMGDPRQVEELFTHLPPLDLLINNAGISQEILLSQMTISDWRTLMATNLDSVFYTCKYAAQEMVKRKRGRIINISSIWGNTGASMEVAYSASKGAINSLTRALAKELAPSNIQVNAIAPGLIDTQMNQGYSQEEWEALLAHIPMGRPGLPEEVGELALLLAKAPAYFTGQILTLDGGWT